MAEATLKQVREFFGLSVSEMTQAWKELSDKDKSDLKKGIGDGTLNY